MKRQAMRHHRKQQGFGVQAATVRCLSKGGLGRGSLTPVPSGTVQGLTESYSTCLQTLKKEGCGVDSTGGNGAPHCIRQGEVHAWRDVEGGRRGRGYRGRGVLRGAIFEDGAENKIRFKWTTSACFLKLKDAILFIASERI
eukprot:scaffold477_cov73-Isochrysis_galbana.AAC.2